MDIRIWATALLVATACAAKPTAPKPTSSPKAQPTKQKQDRSDHFIPDMEDKCWLVRDCDRDFIDDDGCPDFIVTFARGSRVLAGKSAELVKELATELRQRRKVEVLRLHGHVVAGEALPLALARAEAVRTLLRAYPLGGTSLEVGSGGMSRTSQDGFVSFTAAKCRAAAKPD